MLWLFYTTSILAVLCTPAAASVESRVGKISTDVALSSDKLTYWE